MSQTYGTYGPLINVNELTEAVRHAAQDLLGFSQLANPPTGKALGLGAGDTVQYTYFPRVTNSGGQLDENEAIPESSLTPIKGTYTVAEWGNSIKWTGKLEDLSRLTIEDDFMVALVEDLKRLENDAVYDQAALSHWVAVFNSATGNEFLTNNTPTKSQDTELNLANLRFVRRKARANLIPPFDGESYVYVTGVDSADALSFDSDVTDSLKEDSGRSALNGEIGRVAGCRVVEDTQKIAKQGTGSAFDQGFLFGADAVVNEVALPWEIREEVKDFRRQVAVAYYSIQTWYKVLGQSLHSREHIIRVTST